MLTSFLSLIAYIGPGAGFAVAVSFLTILVALLLGLATLLFWPFRMLWAVITGKGRRRSQGRFRRVIVVGLDGLDYERTAKLLDSGELPHLRNLQENGHFGALKSTCPPISPVAWASFLTGVNPGKHNIFDFLRRNPKTYQIELSSSKVAPNGEVKGMRKSVPFWKHLGEAGVVSNILRVPITFPAERFPLNFTLSGMCVPDLRGTQGQFTYFTTNADRSAEIVGASETFQFEGDLATVFLKGPSDNNGSICQLPLQIERKGETVDLSIGRQTKLRLEAGVYSPWVQVKFRVSRFRSAHGICRFLLTETEPDFCLYVTPINIDPQRPSLPVSSPPYFAAYLSKLLGPFATLGIAEDTQARTEGIVDDEAFLDQVWQIHEERERQFFTLLDRVRDGCHVCVFDAPDRIQHLFTRQNPAAGRSENATADQKSSSPCPIDEMYSRLDTMVGKVQEQLKPDDLMMVISDHGFTTFEKGIQLNAWLKENGYLFMKPGMEDADYLTGIDWERTRAYAFGLTGIYINQKGREGKGIVASADADATKLEIQERLSALADPHTGIQAIHRVTLSRQSYSGPYRDSGPDLIVGYAKGYRVSWECAVGRCSGPIISDNTKAWSGDHCVDVDLVPGVFFSNHKVAERKELQLIDLAPSILSAFGVDLPKYFDGTPINFPSEKAAQEE